jgi:cytoskeleton protein RodZ
VFEIGNSLRETRLRQGLDFAEAEQATKIRSKYLRALEDEQFDALPSQTYVKGFLRSYADFLGLDGQLYVDEYNSRFVTGEDDEMVVRPRRSGARPRREPRLERNAVMIALIGIGVVVALVIGAWKLGGNSNISTNQIPNLQHGNKRTPPVHVSRPNVSRLVVSATTGNSLLQVRVNGATGPLLYQGTLDRGQHLGPLVRNKFWLNIGTPENVELKLNGRVLRVGAAKPCVLIVTKRILPAGPGTC